MTTRRELLAGIGAGLALGYLLPGSQGALAQAIEGGLSAETTDEVAEAHRIARDAYIYGYPLVTMEMTRRVMTNVAEVAGGRAPMGRLSNKREYPNAAFRDVTAPNADTLYSTAWVDLGQEPWVLSLPEENGRYYLFPMLDAWTNVIAVPGTRTTGTGPQTYALTGPGWKGTLPDGVKQVASPTALLWLLGRTYCSGTPEDYKAVWALQDQIKLVPLSSFGKSYTAPAAKVDGTVDMKTPVREQVNALSLEAYFSLLAELMMANPPAAADAPILKDMERIGLVPGKPFSLGKLPPKVAKALDGVPTAGWAEIAGHVKAVGVPMNDWLVPLKTGQYGTDYLQRSAITAFGLGANLPQDAVYPVCTRDADGAPLTGDHTYRLHFPSAKLPVKGFWSLTMYNAQWFFVDNPLNRYTISARDKLKTNADGSVDIIVSTKSPGGDMEANWLPAPQGGMVLMLRLYWPDETAPSILDGTWHPPKVERVS